jgi:fatty acyl-CoA reductase
VQIFDWLRKERPEALNKLVPVCGDIMLHELGISQSDQKILADRVSVVFHSAATVKFDEALKVAVDMNIVGTKRIVQLCHRMVKLEVSSLILRCRFYSSAT